MKKVMNKVYQKHRRKNRGEKFKSGRGWMLTLSVLKNVVAYSALVFAR